MRGPLRSIRRHLRLATHYLAQVIKARVQYRGDFIIACVTSFLRQASGLAVVAIIFTNIPLLRDWNRNEVFFIYGFALTAQALFESFSHAFYWFADKYIMRAEFDRILLRPLDPLFQILLENFDLEFVPDLLLGLTILTISGGALGLSLGPANALLLLLMLAGAVLVLAGVFLALASVSFWVEDRVGVLPPFYNLMTFGRYPLTIYHPVLRTLLSWVLPYGFVAFYPSTGFLARGEFGVYFWATPLVGLLSFLVGYGVFRTGIRHYRSTGS